MVIFNITAQSKSYVVFLCGVGGMQLLKANCVTKGNSLLVISVKQ